MSVILIAEVKQCKTFLSLGEKNRSKMQNVNDCHKDNVAKPKTFSYCELKHGRNQLLCKDT